MHFFIGTWLRKLASTFALTILMVVGGLIIDQAYLDNPIGEGTLGVTAEEGYNMPATTEISVTADGFDSIKIDLKSEVGDFGGDIEVLSPDGHMVFQNRFALRHYPPTLMPNPAKWQTFNIRNVGKGTYLVRLTQERPGRAKVFFYQGPFLARMGILPIIAAFIILVLSFTFSSKKLPASNPDNQ
ncbi:MAG: hypothetical protein GQF41_2181 [Candidatus Rifleibacterium amylolyticum]|nr:MAG: hypothetical protein GQF41_2181 [Candidatus Rifleibacterium amylolyticum]